MRTPLLALALLAMLACRARQPPDTPSSGAADPDGGVQPTGGIAPRSLAATEHDASDVEPLREPPLGEPPLGDSIGPASSAQQCLDEACSRSACPPIEPAPHCIVLTLAPGAEARADDLVARAARDQIQVHREGSLWVTYLTDAQIVQHFGGRVAYRRIAASASNTGRTGSLCAAYLEDTRIPPKYARDLASITVGHQICE